MRCLLFLVFFAAFTPLRAEFDARLVPADARWLLYANLTTMHASLVGQQLLTVLEPLFPDSEALHTPEAQNLRLLATAVLIHGVSFSANGEPGDGVLLIEGPQFRRQLEVVLDRSAQQAESIFYKRTDLPFLAYGVKSTLAKGELRSAAASDDLVIVFPPKPVVLASKSRARLAESVRLLDRRGPSLETERKALLRRFVPATQGAYFFGATTITPNFNSSRAESTARNILALIGAVVLAWFVWDPEPRPTKLVPETPEAQRNVMAIARQNVCTPASLLGGDLAPSLRTNYAPVSRAALQEAALKPLVTLLSASFGCGQGTDLHPKPAS